MGSPCNRLQWVEKQINTTFPGIYVNRLQILCGQVSMTTPMGEMMRVMVKAIRADPRLKNGFNFYGESQGALMARAYAMAFNDPPVYNLIAINGPQAGVGLCPMVDQKWVRAICANGAAFLNIYRWPKC